MSKSKLINSQKGVTKQLERSKRQAILMRLVNKHKKNNPNFENLASMMREDPWVAIRWPSYSHQTAYNDFNAVMGLVRDDVKDLAMPYFARQVNLMDEAIGALHDFSKDDQLPPKMRIDALNAMRGYLEQMGRLFGNFAPKEMNIKKATVTMDYDTYQKMKAKAQDQLQIIDGEIE